MMRVRASASLAFEIRGSDPSAAWQSTGSGVCLHVAVTRLLVVVWELAIAMVVVTMKRMKFLILLMIIVKSPMV